MSLISERVKNKNTKMAADAKKNKGIASKNKKELNKSKPTTQVEEVVKVMEEPKTLNLL